MNILVYANCQKNQLVNALSVILMGKARVSGIDINDPRAATQLREIAAARGGTAFDWILTNHGIDDLLPWFDPKRIVAIPSLHFGGFHPDTVYCATTAAPSRPLFFKRNPTISALALWSHGRRLNVDQAAALYREDVFEALGYMDYFDVCCHAILDNYVQHGIDTGHIERFIASRDVFMHGPLHPKFSVTLALAFGICEKLELDPALRFEEVDQMLPDPLQLEYAWGCFPPMAARLGVPGSWMIRYGGEVFPTPKQYLPAAYEFLNGFPHGSVRFFDKDQARFDEFHRIDEVLGRFA